jgi:hypothetical protein
LNASQNQDLSDKTSNLWTSFAVKLKNRTSGSLRSTERVAGFAEILAFATLGPSSASFAEKWMTSVLRRREVILARGIDGLHVFGDRVDAAALRLREFMHRNGVPHRWINTDDQDNFPLLATLGKGPFEFPVIAWSRKVLLQNPSLPVFADFCGIDRSQRRFSIRSSLAAGRLV